MILVDTSVWIHLLAGAAGSALREQDLFRFVTCGPIVQEVLQGLRPGPRSDAFREAFLAIPVVGDPIPLDVYISAADIFRLGRRRGVTIRSSVDCLIAAIAIDRGIPVWHRDRDFASIARFTELEAVAFTGEA
jgi:predicted nucleic acid-binding protein